MKSETELLERPICSSEFIVLHFCLFVCPLPLHLHSSKPRPVCSRCPGPHVLCFFLILVVSHNLYLYFPIMKPIYLFLQDPGQNRYIFSTSVFFYGKGNKSTCISPGCCGSEDSVLVCETKGCWFDSQSGHMPGLQARSPMGGAQEATDQCFSHTLMFLSLSFSLPPPLSKNKK